MLARVVDIFIAALELLEAQAKELRGSVQKLGLSLAVIVAVASMATALLLGGIGMLVASLYMTLAQSTSPAMAALWCGLILWALTGLLLGIATLVLRRRRT